jgi:chemosensory pili system protein ChpA (sensor histidine kinase/response regulator)
MEPEDLQKIMGYYLENANNHLEFIEQHLLNLPNTIEDPETVTELFLAARCGIIGGANLLPISHFHINSIHQTGFCLANCFKVFQQEGSLEVDQQLQELLMQVFYALKALIEPLKEPSSLANDKAQQVMSEIEPIQAALTAHLNRLIKRSRHAYSSDMMIASDLGDKVPTLEDLQLLIDELSMETF